MMRFLVPVALVLGVIPLANAQESMAQESMIACPSQQELEQVLQSDKNFVPDDCREVTISRIDSPAGSLCVMDFRARDPGMLDQLTEAATTTQWWVSCDDLK